MLLACDWVGVRGTNSLPMGVLPVLFSGSFVTFEHVRRRMIESRANALELLRGFQAKSVGGLNEPKEGHA